MHIKDNEMQLTLSEEFYHELNALTVDPKIDLEKLRFLSIVTGREGKYAIFWFKEVYTRGQDFFARAEMLGVPVNSHDVAVSMMNIIAEQLRIADIPIKR